MHTKFILRNSVLSGALLAAVTLMETPVWSQVPGPTQPNLVEASSSPYPVFRVTAVSRSIKAINYHHRQGSTNLAFEGTNLAPKAKGEARVDSKTGATKIDARFDKLPPAQVHGREFLTYVLWAVTPEGRFSNLGEIYLNGDDARLQAATELQSFGMILTAEPYYAVTQPSDVVVMENVIVSGPNKPGTTGTMSPIEAKYELLERGTYNALIPAADRNLTKDDMKDTPLDLKEARHAMAIATTLGARQYAADTMQKAQTDLMNAEAFWRSSKDTKKVQTLARNVTQLAEDARIITVRKREEERLEAERKAAEASVLASKTKAEEEARMRAAADAARARADQEAQQATATAQRERQLADDARRQAELAKIEAEKARLSVLESQRKLEEQRAAAESERLRLEAEQTRIKAMAEEADRQRIAAEQDRARLREELRQQFNLILETRDSARGLIVNMSDVLFDTARFTLRPAAREKLAKVAGIVLAHPGLKLEVEGHTDSVGSDEYNQKLSENRAKSVADFLTKQGLKEEAITSKGFGESTPVADNATASGRQQNRRVELIVSGAIIEKTTTISKIPSSSNE